MTDDKERLLADQKKMLEGWGKMIELHKRSIAVLEAWNADVKKAFFEEYGYWPGEKPPATGQRKDPPAG